MSLADYEPCKVEVEIASGKGPVKIGVMGISTDDLTHIFNAQFGEIQVAVALWQKTMEKRFSELAFFGTLVSKTPLLVAEIISVAANERGNADKAARLPIAAQVLLLNEIYRLTLQDCGGLKNLLAMLGMIRDELPTLDARQQSQSAPASPARH